MEGGIHKAESTEFRDLLYLTSKQPFILRLAFSAGIGGLLFGYDTGPSNYHSLVHSFKKYIKHDSTWSDFAMLNFHS
jgi:hypothetical protein